MRATAARHFTESVPRAARLGRPFELYAERVRVGFELCAQRLGIEAEPRQVVTALPVRAVGAVAEPLAHPRPRISARGMTAVAEEASRRLLRIRDDLTV